MMSMEIFSLLLLLAAIALGFLRRMNTGLLSIAFALVLGHAAGIPDKAVIAGFNSSLFLILLGVTYLFSIAQLNGSLALLAEKVVALTGRRTALVPVVIYLFSTVLSALGPGTVPTIAIMMVLPTCSCSRVGMYKENYFGYMMNDFYTLPLEHKRLILSSAETKIGLPAAAIEKDLWVTCVLQLLFSIDIHAEFLFKGGTSLSKAGNLIQRFSEDIDAHRAICGGVRFPEDGEADEAHADCIERC